MRTAFACVAVLLAPVAFGQGQYIPPGMTITPIVVQSTGWNICRPTTPGQQTRADCAGCCNRALTNGTLTPGQHRNCLTRCMTLQP